MTIKLKPLHEQVMVITGASSGIGLATARAAAKEGVKLVLASRSKDDLEEVEKLIKAEGGEAIHIVADVGKREDVQKIADAAISNFGGFDTWVNNAGISIYGKLEEVSDEDSRRLFDTNFWGMVNGSLVAAKHLKNKGGKIINVGSLVSDVAISYQGMYSASKHAVKGFTNAFRIEMEEENAPISITLIKPGSINTPFPQHAKNYTDKELTLPPPVFAPEEVANAILHAATHEQRNIYIGGNTKMMSSTNKYAPALMDWVSRKMMAKRQFKDKPARKRDGSLYKPVNDGDIHGNYEGMVLQKSYYTRASMHPVLTGAVVAVGAAAIALLTRKG